MVNGFFALLPVGPLQINDLTDVQRSVRDQFQKGGSALSLAMVVGGLVGLVMLTYWLSRQQQRHATPRRPSSPRKLFESLLGKLDCDGEQRRLLLGVLKHARLKHPALLLLSDRAFDCYVSEWRGRAIRIGGAGDDARDDATVVRLRSLLFP